jgi:hypothetical protein
MTEPDSQSYATPVVVASYDALSLIGDAEGDPSIQTGSTIASHEV